MERFIMSVTLIQSKIAAQKSAIERATADMEAVNGNNSRSQLWKDEQLYGKNGHLGTPEPNSIHGRLDAARDNTEISELILETRAKLNADYAAKEYQGVDSSLELLKWNKAQVLGQRLAALHRDAPRQLLTQGYAELESNSGDALAYIVALDALGQHLDAQNLEVRYKENNRTSGQLAVLAQIYTLDNLEKEWNGNTGAQLMAAKLAKYQ